MVVDRRALLGSGLTLGLGLGVGAVALRPTAALPPAGPPVTETYVLIIAGQSQGMTPNSSASTVPSNIATLPGATTTTSGVRIWSPSAGAFEAYVAAQNSDPYPRNPANGYYGPEAEFARLWLGANPGKQLAVVKLNVGATPLQKTGTFQNMSNPASAQIIECWDPTLATDTANADHAKLNVNLATVLKGYNDAAMASLQAEGKVVHHVGMLWLQGQNDAYFQAPSQTYGAALSTFSAWARANLLGGSSAPLVIALVEASSNWTYAAAVRAAQTDFAAGQAQTCTAETSDLPIGADSFHFSAAGVITLAGRMYAALSAVHVPIVTAAPTIPVAVGG